MYKDGYLKTYPHEKLQITYKNFSSKNSYFLENYEITNYDCYNDVTVYSIKFQSIINVEQF